MWWSIYHAAFKTVEKVKDFSQNRLRTVRQKRQKIEWMSENISTFELHWQSSVPIKSVAFFYFKQKLCNQPTRENPRAWKHSKHSQSNISTRVFVQHTLGSVWILDWSLMKLDVEQSYGFIQRLKVILYVECNSPSLKKKKENIPVLSMWRRQLRLLRGGCLRGYSYSSILPLWKKMVQELDQEVLEFDLHPIISNYL